MTEAGRVVGALLAWYAGAARELPWRSDPSPYRVLLSELMLQQTRVDTALPYFERFVARWPTLADLAAADEGEVMRAWAGLGYYARARNLLRCASAARGGLPSDVDGLRALPGIGPYTAGAVASIAFGVRTPAVDGNVERVLSRLDARTADPRCEGRGALWARAAELHAALSEEAHPGDLNQALMELGATVCTPRRPACGRCPLGDLCDGRGTPEAYPARAPRRPPVPVRAAAGILRGPDGVLLARRRQGGLLGGLWEPVRAVLGPGDEPRTALVSVFGRCGVALRAVERVGEVVHVFTHRRLTCGVYGVEGHGDPAPADGYDAVRFVAEPDGVALSALARRVLDAGGISSGRCPLPPSS